MNKKLIGLFLIMWAYTATAKAGGVSPYLPLKLNPVLELELERLLSITGYPALKKPYHIATVNQYLVHVKDTYPQLHGRINRYIKRYKQRAAITHFKSEVRVSNSNEKTLPNSRGRSTDNDFYIEGAAFAQLNKYVIANIAGGYSDSDTKLNFGNFISVGTEYFQADFGYREHWLSPLQDSAQIISTQAVPMLGVTLSNVKPLTDYHIMYELGFGTLEKVDGIVFDGKTSAGRPGFLTMHLSAKPTNWWTISGSRTMQFSGGERGKVGLSKIWDAIIDPVNTDNCGGQSSLQDCNEELGNQQAALGNRFDLMWGDTPYSLYFEVAGEDSANFNNYQLGNVAYSLGLFIPYLSDDESLNITVQSIEDAWYVHHLYRKGYSNDGHKMGHWWGDEKRANDGIGARILSVQYTNDFTNDSHLSLKYHTVNNAFSESNAAVNYERGHYLQLDYNWQYKTHFLGLHLYMGKDVQGDSFSSVGISKTW